MTSHGSAAREEGARRVVVVTSGLAAAQCPRLALRLLP